MAKTDNLTDFLTDVADTIRMKKGTTNKINPQDFSTEIASIQGGSGSNKFAQLVNRSITEVTADDLKGATIIGTYAFGSCSSLISITIPDSVTSIGNYAFEYCSSITSVTIPDSVASIGISAFKDCSGLTSIYIPDSVTSIGTGTFFNCSSLYSAYIPNIDIPISAFKGCSSLVEVGFLRGINMVDILNFAFQNCKSLTNIEIPDTIASIAQSAFQGCDNLTNVIIDHSVTKIGNRAFFKSTGSNITITITAPPPTLGASAFAKSFLTAIRVPAESVEAYKTATNWSAYADYIVAIE